MPASVHAQAKAPHMAAVALTSAAAGLSQIVTGSLPANLAATASPTAGHVWSALLVVGGVLVVVGAWLPQVEIGLRLEGAGHVGLMSGTIVYLIAAVAWMGSPWWVSPAVWWALAVAVASVVRWWQIWHIMWVARRV